MVQARMGSTRLPGKVLLDLEGASVLARVVTRMRRARTVDEIVVATTTTAADESIVAECERLKVSVFRGDEHDVLDRYYRAAKSSQATVVVRVTSDCPLIEPEIADLTVRRFLAEHPDFASNTLIRTYPRGLDTEVFSRQALETAWREASVSYQREHVTPFIFENPQRFRLVNVQAQSDHSDLRWTLDTQADLDFVRAIYRRLGGTDDFGWRDVLAILDREPELLKINQHVRQKALQEG